MANSSNEELYPRKCCNCGCGMSEGYSSDDGYACSNACLFVDGYTKKQFEEDYENEAIYWTQWEEYDAIDVLYTQDGNAVEIDD